MSTFHFSLGKEKKKSKKKSRYRSNLLSLIYVMHLRKIYSSELTPAAMQSTRIFFLIIFLLFFLLQHMWFKHFSATPDIQMQIQHSGISCGVLTFPGLEAGERIIMRHKYSIFNPDKYKPVPIIFLILHKRK